MKAPSELHSEEGIPINKGNIYISETSPKVVAEVYLAQFHQDFTRFLVCRSKEVLSKGRMLLTFRGRPSSSNAATWQPWELKIFAQAINCLVSQVLIYSSLFFNRCFNLSDHFKVIIYCIIDG